MSDASIRILISKQIEAGALQAFRDYARVDVRDDLTGDELVRQLADYDAAVLMLSNQLEALEFERLKGSRLKIIANHAVGHENIDLQAASAAGIRVSNTPDVLTLSSAEMAWALLLALGRRLIEGDQLVRSGQWQGWEPTQLLGHSVIGKTLGIVGAGRIGQAMAKMGQGFGIQILYYSRHRKSDFEQSTGAQYRDLKSLFEESQLLSLHLPGGRETHHLINKALLERVQPDTLLINTGRGSTLDEAALIQALEQGQLAGAALDVYEFEPRVSEALIKLPNVVLAPHLASATVATRRAMALTCLKNIQAVLAGHSPINALN